MRITQREYDALVSRGLLPEQPKPVPKKSPYKNKWEQQYAWELTSRQRFGEILWWAYTPVTLVIVDANGKRCRYTPDFMVVREHLVVKIPDFEFVEVKGHLREAARIRFLAARERYPFFKFTMVHRTKAGDWETMLEES